MRALIGIVVVLALLLVAVWLVILLIRRLRRRAGGMGYSGILTYLRATPKSDDEKRDAVNMFVLGLLLCGLGIFFHPLAIVGVIYLYYGGRKIGYVLLGVGPSAAKDSRGDQSEAPK